MSKQPAVVSVEVEIPDGWEPVAVRAPKEGEWFLSGGEPRQCCVNGAISWRIIVRRKFVWPRWLTAPWIARDANGVWWGYEEEPFLKVTRWDGAAKWCILCDWALDITFPDVPWRESKMRNPNR